MGFLVLIRVVVMLIVVGEAVVEQDLGSSVTCSNLSWLLPCTRKEM